LGKRRNKPAARAKDKPKVDILGMRFDPLTMDEALARIDGFVKEGGPHKIFTPNVALFIWSRSRPYQKRFYDSCDLLPVDGRGLYYASRLLGTPVPEVLSAVFIFFKILEIAPKKGYKLYFLGTKDDILNKAVEEARKKYPGIKIVGARNGYFDESDEARIAKDIRASGADMLFLGMSSPKKEDFVIRNLDSTGVSVCLGVGGSFDVLAGVYHLAPDWVAKAGIEWLYRLIQEPGRMWKRYLTTNTVFGYLLIKELIKRPFRRVL